MYGLLRKYFMPGGKTADVGCGNGRDANWLSENGFRAHGFDSSPELLAIASARYPQIPFRLALLPQLREIEATFDNVVCETVIMHLPKSEIPEAIHNLKRLLAREGVLYLSWRITENEDLRHSDGRLYSAFEPDFVRAQFTESSLVYFEEKISASSGKRICQLVARAENR
jgi:2-polyprenyl-3-methyl-5-hydroxy-6-metoxy-1,4-benzoquinol methylase